MKSFTFLLLWALILLAVLPAPSFALDPNCLDCHEFGDCHLYDCPVNTESGSTFASIPEGVENIVNHAATPVRVFSSEYGLHFYFVGNGSCQNGPFTNHVETYYTIQEEPVSLYSGTNIHTDQPVSIDYIPTERIIRVTTAYADGKDYIFEIDEDNQVEHTAW